MALPVLIVVTVGVLTQMFRYEQKLRRAVFDSDIYKYREANAFWDGVLLGMCIVAAIFQFLT